MDNVADFYHEVTYSDLATKATFDEEGVELTPNIFVERIETELKPRPECKSMEALERVISLRKPQSVVDNFIQLVINGEQWGWFDSYNEYLIEKEEVETYNADLPVVSTTGVETVYAEPKALPNEPVRPTLLTVEEYKAVNATKFESYLKSKGEEINGVQVSLNETNQNGIASVLTALDLAAEVNADLFPLSFNAETATGIVSMSFADLAEFKQFALQFMSARQAFFK